MNTTRILLLAVASFLLLASGGCSDNPTDTPQPMPTACFEMSLKSANPLTFQLDASCSSPVAKAAGTLEYRWDFDGDGTFDYPNATDYTNDPMAEWALPNTKIYNPVLEVRDEKNRVTKTTQALDPGSTDYVVPDEGTPGMIYTWAGSGKPGYVGENRPLLQCRFSQPADLTITSTGTTYILDWNNHCVRKVTPEGTLKTVIGVPTFPGDGPGIYYPDENDLIEPVDALHAYLNHPTQMEELPGGRLAVAAWHNHKVRDYDPSSGMIFVSCGSGPGFTGDGEGREHVKFKQVEQVRFHDGDLYVLDQVNLRVRRIHDYMTDPNGLVETVVGNGEQGPPCQECVATEASLNYELSDNPPMNGAICFDDKGYLYVSDTLNNVVRRVDFSQDPPTIKIIAGNGVATFAGDDGPATEASLNWPMDLEIGPDGRLYVADEYNHAIRAIDLDTGIITTVAGRGEAIQSDYYVPPSWEIGDGGPATQAYLNHPRGIDFDDQGRLYIADTFQYRIRRMTLPTQEVN